MKVSTRFVRWWRVGCCLTLAAGFIWGAVALWWWALAGMSQAAQSANYVTIFVLLVGGGIAAAAPWTVEGEQ